MLEDECLAPQGRLRRLYDAVQALPEEQRSAALARLCPDDRVLYGRVRRLSRHTEEPHGVLACVENFARQHINQFAEVEEAGQNVGDYQLIEPIEEGAFGRVWRARQLAPLERTVALKILKQGLDSESVLRRFETERRALALMSHQNIASVFGAGTTPQGRPFFAMELIQGASIVDYCQQNRLPVRARLELFEQVCRAVHHANERGFVHRDLKPNNILVQTLDGRPLAKVIDFGIAKALGTDLTSETLMHGGEWLLGSLGYMSPEQVASPGSVNPQADVYSLGAILYEIVVGKRLLDRRLLRGKNILQCAQMMRDFVPTPPSRAMRASRTNSCDAADLDRVIGKALARDRDQRYESAAALADEVERLRLGQQVLAKAGAPRRPWKGLRTTLRRCSTRRAAVLFVSLFTVVCILSIAIPPTTAVMTGAATFVDSAEQTETVPPVEPPRDRPAERPLALTSELILGEWHYLDSLHPPGDRVRFRAATRDSGRFHDRWNWTFRVLDRLSFVVDFWDEGDTNDLFLRFDSNLEQATGQFTDGKGREHVITLTRLTAEDDG